MCISKNKLSRYLTGFTLLEILIALFIFTIVSIMLLGGLRSVIHSQSGTEQQATELRELQLTTLLLSRDIEQAVNRPVLNTLGKEEAAFIGQSRTMTFTHFGLAANSALQRTRYNEDQGALFRATWMVLDQANTSQPHARILLREVRNLRFQYLDKEGRFHDNWPLEGVQDQPLPRAVRVSISIFSWGDISQLYVISAKSGETPIASDKP